MKLHSAGWDLRELNLNWKALMIIWEIPIKLCMDITLNMSEEFNWIYYIPKESVT